MKKTKKATATPTHLKYVTKPTRQMLEQVNSKPKPSTLIAELVSGYVLKSSAVGRLLTTSSPTPENVYFALQRLHMP